jgi:hypothetical protein
MIERINRMIDRIKQLVGMAYTTPPVRTAVQVGLGVLLAAFAANHLSLFDGGVWKVALQAALAAAAAKIQASVRA